MRGPPPPPPWASALCAFGVTGTNGKTSTTSMLASILARDRRPVARTSTLGSYLDEERLTLPMDHGGFLEVMRRARDGGGRYAVLELTSESLAHGMAKAWPLHAGVFTNLSPDHLNYHRSFEHYLASKAQLFMHLQPGGLAVLNADDPVSALLAEVIPAGVERYDYGRSEHARVRIESIEPAWEGTSLRLCWQGRQLALRTSAIGEPFGMNAAAAATAALAHGLDPSLVAEGLAAAVTPPGRFEVIHREPDVVVDYAHTPDALHHTLRTARALCRGRLAVVLGAGGDRDRDKRPAMGEQAGAADRVWLTSDNPRGEDPLEIAASLRAGIAPDSGAVVTVELDRRRAIEAALREASTDDLVLIAGKGHEQVQEIAGERRPFSDAAAARRWLAQRDS